MQDRHSRIYYLTRNRVLLGKCVAGILGVAVAISLGIYSFHDKPEAQMDVVLQKRLSVQDQLIESCRRLLNATTPDPAGLAHWFRQSAAVYHAEVVDVEFDPVLLRLGDLDLQALIDKHAKAGNGDVFAAFTRCLFSDAPAEKAKARTALEQFVEKGGSPAPPFAHEFVGDFFYEDKRYGEALSAYLKEIANPEAGHSRNFALRVALKLEDAAALNALCANPLVLEEAAPEHLWHAAKLTGNKSVLFKAILLIQVQRFGQHTALALALVAAGMWYVVLVHSASAERWRFVRYLPALLAGVASVGLIDLWQGAWEYPNDPENQQSMAQEALHWILYVGIPEEVAKLVLFFPFLPWLVRKGNGVKAALTAGCVGLGFAFNENLGYYSEYGGRVAISRLVTANFMHLALTGLLGWHLWDLVRSKFHTAANFVTIFIIISSAHGLYDFALSARSSELGLDIASIIILAVAARYYLQLLSPAQEIRRRMTVSSTSVFLIGCSLLIGLLMVVLVYQEQSLLGITGVLKLSLGVIPVGLIYIKEFNEV